MTTHRNFIAVYRWRVEPAVEEDFKARWRDITQEAGKLGALGSTLTRDADGEFVAIALWPSEQTRADAFARMTPRPPLEGVIRLSETPLYVEDDMWAVSPFREG